MFNGISLIKQKNIENFDFKNIIKNYFEKNKSFFKLISYDEFYSNNEALQVERYFMPKFRGSVLSEFCKPIKVERKLTERSGHSVKITDLLLILFLWVTTAIRIKIMHLFRSTQSIK